LKKILVIVFIFYLLQPVFAGSPGIPLDYKIPASTRIQHLDSLSIVEESFSIFGPDELPLDPAFYEMDFISTRIILRIPDFWLQDSLRVVYRVWPINFSTPVFARDTSLISLPGPGEDPVSVRIGTPFPQQGLLQYEGLQSSGSITRGLTMGNRQDPVLNSAMNLQLNGKLTDEISIMAVVSDQNIPFQPEGTTQQLQDFDKVFIRLNGFGAALTAGDFELGTPAGHFLKINRKARGGLIGYEGVVGDSTVLGGGRLRTSVAGAISRGKHARNQIQGQEGNQGPYRLRGNDNESYILILSGTERVFIDGRALQRGMDRDYIIDYNTAEITFMPSIMITRESRIIVEFEYAERNYVRSMTFAAAELEYEKASFRVNFFSEQDHRNQPLFQEVSDERKTLMSAVGDSINQAFDWNVDSTGFRNDRVMYRMTDSLGFNAVFVYSIDPEVAVYQPGFSYVGQGQGNYTQVSTAANGRVFKWISPQNGVPQGTHEPRIQLVTPKKHQMVTLGGDLKITSNTMLNYEYAATNQDINLFSEQDKGNDLGQAFQIELSDVRIAKGSTSGPWTLTSRAMYEFADSYFRPLERFRSVEFERDWNLENLNPNDNQNEHLPGFSFIADNPNRGRIAYSFRSYLKGDQYQGFINSLNGSMKWSKNHIGYNGSLLNSSGFRQTQFYRHSTFYHRDLNLLRAGIEHQTENNRISHQDQDSLAQNSLQFSQLEVFLAQADTAVNQYRVFYRIRDDGMPSGSRFENASRAHNYGLQYRNLRNSDQRLDIQFIYRDLEVLHERFSGEKSEQTINIRGDYFSRWAKGVITSALFYETASGRERKKEYLYVEVPAGQGAYIWNDYNGNGIRELNEFELTPYPDEANFIRVFIPTDEFVPVYSTAISHSVNLEPSVIWREATGMKRFIARFSNRLNYRIDNKKQGKTENFNPFLVDVDDSLLISLSSVVRNSVFFNRSHPTYSFEWTFQDNRNKNLLSNGFESRQTGSNALRSRWNILRVLSIQGQAEWGDRIAESEYFLQRNFHVSFYSLEPSVSYQPRNNLRMSMMYGFHHQDNISGTEESKSHKITLDGRLSFPSRGSLQMRYQISQISFPYNPNTPVAFEMLQGLREGINHIWNINWQHNINAYMQLSLQYNGRKPPGVGTIHTGSVQLRALF
jgi:hypothetical protein